MLCQAIIHLYFCQQLHQGVCLTFLKMTWWQLSLLCKVITLKSPCGKMKAFSQLCCEGRHYRSWLLCHNKHFRNLKLGSTNWVILTTRNWCDTPGWAVAIKPHQGKHLGMCHNFSTLILTIQDFELDFPDGLVVQDLPCNAGDTGSIPGLGRSHMLQSN